MGQFPSPTKTWHDSTYASIDPTRPELSLAGKSVVVTGGGSGIGLAISKAFALAGISKLAIIGRRPEVLAKAEATIKSLGGGKTEVFTIPADVANEEQVNQAFSKIKAQFGGKPLDILVNNAGYFSGTGPTTVETLTTSFEVNVKGLFLVTAAFIANATSNATLINISTGIAHLPFFGASFTSYASTKLAGSKIIEYLQAEHPSLHIVDIHPGQVTETEMAAQVGGLPHIDDVELPGNFTVWATSPEAKFLKGKLVWANWDVDELKEISKEIESTSLLTFGLDGFSSFKY